jgi:pimeloyl-ACP methyl ester carboxylesterase
MKNAMTLKALMLFMLAATAGAAPCANLFGERCRIALSTGISMTYFDAGSPTGEPLILLHTDTTSAVEWAWTVEALLELDPGLHVYALDQRGAGGTTLPDTPECWTNPNRCIRRIDLAADVLAFMDAVHLGKAILVGHAMGAGAARTVALDAPERVVKLILSGTGLARAAALPGPAGTPTRPPWEGMRPLGWQAMLEARGVAWPGGALHMRPIDIDPEAVHDIIAHWDISAIAPAPVVAMIAAQTAAESLATWGTMDPLPAPPSPPERLENLSVPTLVLWGSEDAGLDRASQQRLIDVLQAASHSHPGMVFYWKQYGVRPPPASGDKHDADDIGHNLSWEAPRQLARDIDRFVRTGAPTPDLYRSDAPRDRQTIVVEPGKATVVTSAR